MSDTKETALASALPCPFCGSRNIIIEEVFVTGRGVEEPAECEDCGGQGPSGRDGYESIVQQWNRRAVDHD